MAIPSVSVPASSGTVSVDKDKSALKKLSKKRRAKLLEADSSPKNDTSDAAKTKKKKKIKSDKSPPVSEDGPATEAPTSVNSTVTSPAEVQPAEFRASHAIKVTGVNPIPDPWMTFKQAPFSEMLKKPLIAAGFTAPTVTQSQSWPLVCTGVDLISIAKTGSGKTGV